MGAVSTIGLDLAKSLFQVHRIDVTRAVLMSTSELCEGLPQPQ